MAEECRICNSNIYSPAWTLCGHCFCDSCIRLHITRVPKCPVCEEVVLIEDLSQQHQRRSSSMAIGGGDGGGGGGDATTAHRSTPTAPSSSLTHAPDVTPYTLPPDGPPPYCSTPQRDILPGFENGVDIRSRAQPGVEYSTLLRNSNLANDPDNDMRKKYKSLKKSVTVSSLLAVVLFVIITCLLVIILASKQNPVCDLSTPHSEALTVNIIGEIRLAREQARSDHRDLQNRLSEIFSHHSSLITGGLSKQIIEAKDNITTDFLKLEKKLNEIFRKVAVLQSQTAALTNSCHTRNYVSLDLCLLSTVISVCVRFLLLH